MRKSRRRRDTIAGTNTRMARKTSRISFQDEVVVYRSKQDGCWIAHSLRADQIGTGERVVEALADLIRAMRALTDLARRDESIAYLREAPADVQAIAKRSTPLPKEVFEVAHKMVTGEWPDEFELDFRPKNDHATFKAALPEGVCR